MGGCTNQRIEIGIYLIMSLRIYVIIQTIIGFLLISRIANHIKISDN